MASATSVWGKLQASHLWSSPDMFKCGACHNLSLSWKIKSSLLFRCLLQACFWVILWTARLGAQGLVSPINGVGRHGSGWARSCRGLLSQVRQRAKGLQAAQAILLEVQASLVGRIWLLATPKEIEKENPTVVSYFSFFLEFPVDSKPPVIWTHAGKGRSPWRQSRM
jgi:hypothetical protein